MTTQFEWGDDEQQPETLADAIALGMEYASEQCAFHYTDGDRACATATAVLGITKGKYAQPGSLSQGAFLWFYAKLKEVERAFTTPQVGCNLYILNDHERLSREDIIGILDAEGI